MPRSKKYGLALLALLFLGFVIFAFHRPWSQDESMYMYSAKLIRTEGAIPYRDFYYPQMPLYLPMLTAWQWAFGPDLVYHRLLSVLAMGLLLGWMIRRVRLGWIAALLTLSNPLVWSYFVLVKPYAWASLFALVALSLAAKSSFLSGLALGASSMIRLMFIALAAPAGIRSLRGRPFRFLSGLLLALAPSALIYFLFPQPFWFGILGYHARKSAARADHGMWPVIRIVSDMMSHPAQLLLWGLFLFALCYSLIRIRKHRHQHAEVWIWVGSIILILLSTLRLRPYYDEYIATAIPFVCVCVAAFLSSLESLPKLIFQSFLVVAIAVGSLGVGWSTFRSVHAPAALEPMNSISSVREVAREIGKMSAPGDRVVTFWSGYMIENQQRLPQGLETGLHVTEMGATLSEPEAALYHILQPVQVGDLIRNRAVPLVVIGLATPLGFEELVAKYYQFRKEVAGARFYGKTLP